MKTIKNFIKIEKNIYIIIMSIAAIMFFIGIFAQIDEMKSNEYTQYSTLTFIFAFCLISFFLRPVNMIKTFNLSICMGKTRKEYLKATIIISLMLNTIISLICMVSILIQNKIFSGRKELFGVNHLVDWKIILTFILFATALNIFVAAMILRYDKKAYWIFWGIYMFLCLVPGNVADAMESDNDSFYKTIGNAVVKVLEKTDLKQILLAIVIFALGLFFIAEVTIKKVDIKK